MSQHHMEAVFEKGVFRPLHRNEVSLAEGQHVRLVVDDTAPSPSKSVLAMAKSVYEGLSPAQIHEVEAIILDRRPWFSHTDET